MLRDALSLQCLTHPIAAGRDTRESIGTSRLLHVIEAEKS